MEYKIYQIPNYADFRTYLQGDNVRKVLIVLSDHDFQSNSDFLVKIMQAISFDLDQDCARIALPDSISIQLAQSVKSLGIRNTIVFGLPGETLALHVKIQPYTPILIGESSFLFVHALGEIAADQQKKKALWNALKVLVQKDDTT